MIALAISCALAAAPLAEDLPADLTGADKVLHAGASGTLALAGYGGAALLDAPLPLRLAAGAGVGLGAGLAKEALDLAGFGTPSVGDLVFDALGVGAALGIALALDALWRAEETPLPAVVPAAQSAP